MDIAALRSTSLGDTSSLERLERNPCVSESEKANEASRQFESLLLRQILTAARKTVIHSDLETKSTATDIYQDLVNSQLADAISQSGTFGLARSLQVQLGRQVHPSASPEPESPSTPVTPTVGAPTHR